MLRHFEGKLEGSERIGITLENGDRFSITVKELLSNCIDAEYGKRLEKMMRALENQFKKTTKSGGK